MSKKAMEKALSFFVLQDIFLTETAPYWPTWSCPGSAYVLRKRTVPFQQYRTPRSTASAKPFTPTRRESKARLVRSSARIVSTRMGYPMSVCRQPGRVIEEIRRGNPLSMPASAIDRLDGDGLSIGPVPTPEHPGTPSSCITQQFSQAARENSMPSNG